MKLHLGCGERYLDGYVNIDLPLSAHSVQKISMADLQADILRVRYSAGTVDEVRLHHVFEHFPRPVACALLASWYSWLTPGGKIRVEVPDFRKTSRVMLDPQASFKEFGVAERHIFGSHEAGWAAHYEGYTPDSLTRFIESYGFKVKEFMENSYKGTYNIEIIAEKSGRELSKTELDSITEKYLKNFLVDESESELRMLSVWMDIYRRQTARTMAPEGYKRRGSASHRLQAALTVFLVYRGIVPVYRHKQGGCV